MKTEFLVQGSNFTANIWCSLRIMNKALSLLEHQQISIQRSTPGTDFEKVRMMRGGASLYWNGRGRWMLMSPAMGSEEVRGAVSQLRAGYNLYRASKHLQEADRWASTAKEFCCEHRGMLSVYPSGEQARRS